MHGVPRNLDLGFLRGTILVQVCIGQYDVQFNFHPEGKVSVLGKWELANGSGEQLDRNFPDGSKRPPYQLHRLLGHRVVGSEVDAPRSFTLIFDSGDILRVFDDSKEYESFEIQPSGIYV